MDNPRPPERRGRRRPKKHTILLAEDDGPFRRLLAGVLRGDGYMVIESNNGADLAEYVAFAAEHSTLCHRPDLVITDIRMPCLSGLDVMATLQHAGCMPRTVVMTAFPGRAPCSLRNLPQTASV